MRKHLNILSLFWLFINILSPQFTQAQSGITILSGGTFAASGSAAINIIDGDLVNNGTYTKSTETITFAGTSAKVMSGSSATDLYNLSITNTGGITTQLSSLSTNNLTVASGAKFTVDPAKNVTVNGTLTNSASTTGLLVKGSVAGNGSLIHNTSGVAATVQSYTARPVWRLISPPVSGQNVSTFSPLSDIAHTTTGSPTYYGIRSYNEGANQWYSFFNTDSLANYGSLKVGKGYAARKDSLSHATYPSQDYVVYAGTMQVGAINPAVTRTASNRGFNCIGNPYTAPIAINTAADATNNFISVNSTSLDPSYVAIYVWEDGTQYRAINNSYSASYVPVGAGFFVRVKTGTTSLQMTTAMRKIQSDIAFREANAEWTGFDLVATTASGKLSTTIKLNPEMTDGVDVSYDGGFMRMSNNYALYTRLVNDNGINFSVQCLTDTLIHKIIPVGFDYTLGGEVAFSVADLSLPEGVTASLEDRIAVVTTPLNGSDTNYKALLPTQTVGVGRFFLHLTQRNTDTNTPISSVKIGVNISAKKINIIGSVGANATASIFSANGVLEGKFTLQNSSLNSVSSTSLKSGFYILIVESDKGKVAKKFRL